VGRVGQGPELACDSSVPFALLGARAQPAGHPWRPSPGDHLRSLWWSGPRVSWGSWGLPSAPRSQGLVVRTDSAPGPVRLLFFLFRLRSAGGHGGRCAPGLARLLSSVHASARASRWVPAGSGRVRLLGFCVVPVPLLSALCRASFVFLFSIAVGALRVGILWLSLVSRFFHAAFYASTFM
jgi:hypothetical protein